MYGFKKLHCDKVTEGPSSYLTLSKVPFRGPTSLQPRTKLHYTFVDVETSDVNVDVNVDVDGRRNRRRRRRRRQRRRRRRR